MRKIIFILAFGMLLGACMRREDLEPEQVSLTAEGLFVVCEGNFQYGNATISFYDPDSGAVQNEIFYRANGMKLGDVAQSMTIHRTASGEELGWICVNNSHVLFAVDPTTMEVKGRVENIGQPRYIHFVNDHKAYVSQIWDNRIVIIDPAAYRITGYIEVPDMEPSRGSTEQMVSCGGMVYCSCWSYQNRIIRIDPDTDTVTGSLQIGKQPRSLVADSRCRLWTITDGGIDEPGSAHEAPALYCIDSESMSVIRAMPFDTDATPSSLAIDASGDTLYWIERSVWQMAIDERVLPDKPIIERSNTLFYALTVSPLTGDIYVADAVDYQQPGKIYRYSAAGMLLDEFYTGVTPGAFCWK